MGVLEQKFQGHQSRLLSPTANQARRESDSLFHLFVPCFYFENRFNDSFLSLVNFFSIFSQYPQFSPPFYLFSHQHHPFQNETDAIIRPTPGTSADVPDVPSNTPMLLDSMFNHISSYFRPGVKRHGTLMNEIASYSSDLLRTSRDSFESHLIFSFASTSDNLGDICPFF